MKISSQNEILYEEESFDFKKVFFKYFYFWKVFIGSCFIFFVIAFTYLRYTPKSYVSSAKIKIVDKKETSLELPTASDLFSKSKINLENEIEVLRSYPILEQVINNKNLQASIFGIGNIMNSLIVDYPFDVEINISGNDIRSAKYTLSVTDKGFEITDDSKKYNFIGTSSKNQKHDLPFNINNFDKIKYNELNNKGYIIKLNDLDELIALFKKNLKLSQVGKDSEVIRLDYQSTNPRYANTFLNELIDVFNNDGIQDRQLIHKRTIEFVNNRYSYLSLELDSIEITKQLYKTRNDLVDLTANSAISLEKSFKSKENIFSIENQISVTNLLITTLNDSKLELLPANIGIESAEINLLISDYNETILDRKKLILSAGLNNPSIKQLDDIIRDTRSNIIFSLQSHLSQLEKTRDQLSNQFYEYDNQVSNLPEKEKILRAIERNQEIKEALYLFLMQKREEAEVSYAVTEPSIKVVEYAMVDKFQISPNSLFIYIFSIVLGLVIPFIILYIFFVFDNKVYSKEQLEDLDLPLAIVGEIPEINDQANTTILSSNERSPLAESFRVLCSKLKFFNKKDVTNGQVVMVTSTIKGEGKTFCAMNLSFTQSTLGKKVLLIGADLHNPQIHTYLDVEKNVDGLVNFLVDDDFSWKKSLIKPPSMDNCDILIGGQIPPNPAQLLSNNNFKKLIAEAKELYDVIVIDTPPCLLVSDTLNISYLADLLLFVVRCNHTSKEVLDFIKDSYANKIIKDNSMLVLNGLGSSSRYGYAYNYSYGYKYTYNYNYGYGYDYSSDN